VSWAGEPKIGPSCVEIEQEHSESAAATIRIGRNAGDRLNGR